MTPDAALGELHAAADAERAKSVAAYMKVPRAYLGVPVPEIAAMTRRWRKGLLPSGRVTLADALWRTDIHEARLAAAKLLTETRIPDDGPVWRLIASWVRDFDGWALADHACEAGRLRLVADPSRLDEVEGWTRDESLWVRRAALVITLPWARLPHPSPAERAARERILGWATGYAGDPEWFIQKAVAWWLRELSHRDPDRVSDWLADYGGRLKPFARKDAGRHL